MNNNAIVRVLDGLSELIMNDLYAADGEGRNPQRNADAMDYYVKTHKDRAEILRDIRTRFENVMAQTMELQP